MNEIVEIHLSSRLHKGYIATIDKIDIDLSMVKWNIHPQGYATRAIMVNGKRTTCLLHRVILERVLGRPLSKGEVCDHRDRNPLNNMRSNLRVATLLENSRNSCNRPNTASGYKGVSWRKDRNKWHASIRHNGKANFLGLFDERDDAARSYNAAAIKYFGEFAYLNIIPESEDAS